MWIRRCLYLEEPLADETLNQLTCKKYGANTLNPEMSCLHRQMQPSWVGLNMSIGKCTYIYLEMT